MSKIAVTRIPGRPDIELPAFYESFEWYYPNCELETKNWVVENAQADWIYFDCGANIGYYSILFSKMSPEGHIHAVEPTTTATMLVENLVHNKCPNVTVHQKALGQYPGRRKEKIFRLWGGPPDELEYDFTTIDILTEELNLQKLDCLKIDVDSFDFEVLMGAEKTLEKFDPWLVVELNHALGVRGYSNMAALSWLVERGYKNTIVLDFDNFIFKKSVPAAMFTTSRNIQLNFPWKQEVAE